MFYISNLSHFIALDKNLPISLVGKYLTPKIIKNLDPGSMISRLSAGYEFLKL